MTHQIRWHPPYDFATARPTFIDAWTQAWLDLAPASEIIHLNKEEMNALGSQIIGFRHWFKPASARPLYNLAQRLDAAIARLGRSCFVRLTSRSPKDSLHSVRKGMKVTDGQQALALLVEGSQRCAADCRMALDAGHPLGIVVRQWIDFPPWAEFRCFMKDRRWVGASQGQCKERAVFPKIDEHQTAIINTLHQSMQRIMASSPIQNAAFDWVYQPSTTSNPPSNLAILLDVNPLLNVTDLGLFCSFDDFDNTFRFYSSDGVAKLALPLSFND